MLLLLDDPEWSRWSDREIARRTATDHSWVSKLRREGRTGGVVKPHPRARSAGRPDADGGDVQDPEEPAVRWCRAINILESVLGGLPGKATLAELPAGRREVLRDRFIGFSRKLREVG